MSEADLEHGLELARLSGELRVVGSIVDRMAMPTLSTFLHGRSKRVDKLAERAILRSTGTRALAAALAATGADLADLSADDVAQGIVRMAASDAMAEAGDELFVRGIGTQLRGADEVESAVQLGRAARGAAATAVAEGVAGGAEFGTAAAEEGLAEGLAGTART
jgi:hypothetical protein